MDRRNFLRTAGAATLAPLVPMPAIAASAPAATANQFQVGWAALFARANNRASPELIQKWLQVGPGQAQAVMDRLVQNGVLTPSMSGGAVATKPLYPKGGVPGFMGKARDIGSELMDFLEDTDPDPEDAALSEVEEEGIDPAPEVKEI